MKTITEKKEYIDETSEYTKEQIDSVKIPKDENIKFRTTKRTDDKYDYLSEDLRDDIVEMLYRYNLGGLCDPDIQNISYEVIGFIREESAHHYMDGFHAGMYAATHPESKMGYR